jgi:NAD-dependent dihydropyrimidine dehydrogenase PreA subunit
MTFLTVANRKTQQEPTLCDAGHGIPARAPVNSVRYQCGIGIYCKPGGFSMYVITVDVAKCQGCADCVDTCPNELIAMVEENGKQYAMFKGDPDDCIGCYSCESGCEEGAIAITEL